MIYFLNRILVAVSMHFTFMRPIKIALHLTFKELPAQLQHIFRS